MRRSGGDDVHRSSSQPSFSCRSSTRAPPRYPGSASERKEAMTAWWLAINSYLKRVVSGAVTMVREVAYVAKVRYRLLEVLTEFEDLFDRTLGD